MLEFISTFCLLFVFSFDFSGTVVSVPLGCQKFKPGDSIYGTMPPGKREMVHAPRLH
jgi:NADPH:quinone reductase-like Zn-dependent oxidoreductase